ncbi:hypothetical protein BGX21_009697 [Mortierella sp. AD011]|nr:hypothetical protein BGX20_003764 [Mortierella sp. AD010]KAF9402542.1 hypothetical protein BGX21_009697 [Mortierella sp. AD011]
MDQHEKDLLSNLGLQPGAEGETPIYGNDNNSRIVDETLARFSSSWDTPPLSSMSREQVQGESTFRNMLSSPVKQSGSDEPTSSSSRMEEEDLLHVEKSRVLEMLRHMTSEVDQLESRLQAIKRKRARTAASAVQKQQEIQEVEAQEMRQILGSVHQMSIAESPKGRAGRPKVNTPLSQTVSNVDVDMIRVLQGFTNIAFTSIEHRSISTLDPGGGGGRQYHIAGLCFQLDFDIEFTVHDPDLDLSNVRIHVPRSASAELGQFISSAQSKSLLLPFFRTLSQYGQMDYDRQVVMNNLAKRFPKLLKTNRVINKSVKARQSLKTEDAASPIGVSPAGPGVQSLTFCGARKSSPELVFHWTIDVSDQGKIIPRVRLLPRMPKKWRQADEKATLDAIPTQFVRLLQLKGTESAVAILLQCVYGRQVASESKEE